MPRGGLASKAPASNLLTEGIPGKEMETQMLISDVLVQKGPRVETVYPHVRLDQIPRIFDERNISSVIVADLTGKPLGVVTDRLLIQMLARHGRAALQLTAVECMAAPVPTCAPDESIQEALTMMTEQRVRHLLVISDHKMVGVVSIGDLVKYRLRDSDLETRVLRELAYGRMVEAE